MPSFVANPPCADKPQSYAYHSTEDSSYAAMVETAHLFGCQRHSGGRCSWISRFVFRLQHPFREQARSFANSCFHLHFRCIEFLRLADGRSHCALGPQLLGLEDVVVGRDWSGYWSGSDLWPRSVCLHYRPTFVRVRSTYIDACPGRSGSLDNMHHHLSPSCSPPNFFSGHCALSGCFLLSRRIRILAASPTL